MKRYIRTKDGRIIDIQKFIDNEKDTPYYYDFKFEEIKNEGDSCALNWTAVGSKENPIKQQVGKRCQFGVTIDSPFIAQADTNLGFIWRDMDGQRAYLCRKNERERGSRAIMTYGQAKKDFVLFAVFVPVKNKKGKTKLEEIDLEKENIPDDTEGKVGGFDAYQGYPLSVVPRLCFVVNEARKTK